jgi:hypothetical protein
MQIDLTLAVNYVPAALCLIRLLFYLFLMGVFHSGEEIGGYTILGLVLWMDRVIFRVYIKNIIFDSSAIILAVFISNVFLTLRTYNTKPYMSFLGVVVNFGWMGSAVCMILEPVHLRKVFEKRARMYHVVPAFITALAIGAQIQVHADREENGMRFYRGVSFALLSLVWIYVVGIHQSQSIEPLKDNSSHFIARFTPVLYLPHTLSFLFSAMAWIAMGYQYYELFLAHRASQQEGDVELGHVAQEQPVARADYMPVIQEDPQEYEEMFRLAKQSRSSESAGNKAL